MDGTQDDIIWEESYIFVIYQSTQEYSQQNESWQNHSIPQYDFKASTSASHILVDVYVRGVSPWV